MFINRAVLSLAVITLLVGCTEAPKKLTPRYATIGPRTDIPVCLNETILQYTDLENTEPSPVSGYGLVVNLHGTGGSRVPTPVREFMIKELARHDFGSAITGLAAPEEVLRSKNVAIVRVDGLLPVGARAGNGWNSWFDVRVSIPPESDASSLAHGDLYLCDLKKFGANPSDPGNLTVEVKAQAKGPVYLNPAYVVDAKLDTPEAIAGRKAGIVLGGARAMQDRPLVLRVRTPGTRLARAIEARIIEHFADVVDDDLREDAGSDRASLKKVANAMDEGVIYVYVPKAYKDDVDHFIRVTRHLYLQGENPQWAATQAGLLAEEMLKPNAFVDDISYAMEGLGKPALHALAPLLSNSKADVQFASARAAAYLDDPAAVPVLLSIASTPGNVFRVNAVEVLSNLPASPRIDRLCRSLLDSDEASVREEAYKLLARHQDPSIYTKWITFKGEQVFALDIVDSSAKPMVYASSQGMPRVAIFGSEMQLDLPLIFHSMDDKLMISSGNDGANVDISYRGEKFVSVPSPPSIAQIVGRLAGDDDIGRSGLHFNYGDVVGILQQLIDQQRVSGRNGDARLLASFVLEQPSTGFEPIQAGRPLLRNEGRPQSDRPAGSQPEENHLLRQPATNPVAVGVR